MNDTTETTTVADPEIVAAPEPIKPVEPEFTLSLVPPEQLNVETDFVKAEEVPELWPKIKEMAKILITNKGAGLNAVQVGINKRIFLIWKEGDRCSVFFNASYKPIKSQGKIAFYEGCLSFPGKTFEVERFRKVKVTYDEYDFNKAKFIRRSKSVESVIGIIMQHEIDHQFGKTVDKIGKEVDLQKKLQEIETLNKAEKPTENEVAQA